MKKLTLIGLGVLMSAVSFGQDDFLSKNVRFGLKVTPSIDWYKSGEKITEKEGVGMKFGGGLSVEFRLTNVAVIATGAQIDLQGGTVKFKNDVSGNPSTNYVTYYYDKENDEIADYNTADNESATNPTKYDTYMVNQRKYQMTYITIPLALKLRTKEIGAMTYFGMVGINSSIKYSGKATDEVQKQNLISGWGSPETISKTKIKDMAAVNEALNIGAGTEWNLSGTTSLVFQLNYLLGFTNVAKSESDYLRKQTVGTADGSALKQNLKSNSIGLTIGVLF